MDGLYVYAIAQRPAKACPTGIFGRPLRSMRVGRLHVVVEPALRAPKPSVAKITAQAKIVAALVASGADLLPARFGSHVAGVTELQHALGARSADLQAMLRRTRGCVQMTVRVPATPSGPRTSARRPARRARSGAEYLRERAAAAAGTGHPLVAALNRAVKPYIKAVRVDWAKEPAAFVRVHHLVRRARVADYAWTITRELARRGGGAISISGPWAPFAFAEVT
ncbi:MAG TPA: GvpL/GvpF family gas vesicle protein [Vicinamibacterales bacterium]|nr:GvpL/GvpF family gas vesicle protein [Vicinamibacterales bacterium]